METSATRKEFCPVDLPPQVAQAIHRLMQESGWMRTYMGSIHDAREALWHYFRMGKLRIRREGGIDVLGEEGGYRIVREETADGVRYAMEKPGDWREYFDEDDGGLEEAACHMSWHYLLFWEPEGYDGTVPDFIPGNVR